MSKSGLYAIAAVAILTLLSLVYFAFTFEAPQGTTTVLIEPPAPTIEPPESAERPSQGQQSPTALPQISIQPEADSPPIVAAVAEEVEIAPPP